MSNEPKFDNTGSNRLRKFFEEIDEVVERTDGAYCNDCELSGQGKSVSALEYQHQTYGTDEFDLEELVVRLQSDADIVGAYVLNRPPASFEIEFFTDLFLAMTGHPIEFNAQGEDAPDWYYRAIRASYDLVKSPPITFRDEYDRMKLFVGRALKTSTILDRPQMDWFHRHLDVFVLGSAGLINDEYVREGMVDVIRGRISPVAYKGLRRQATGLGIRLPQTALSFLGEAVLSIADLPTYNLDSALFQLSQLYDPDDSAIQMAWNQVGVVRDLRNVVLAPSSEFGGACDLLRETLGKNAHLSKQQLMGICSTLPEQAKVARAYLGIEPSKGRNYVPPDLALVDPRYLPDVLNE